MLTIDALKACGANTDEGLARCMNMEPFYLKMVGMVLSDDSGHFRRLADAMAAGNTGEAFESAHALKGATGNVALTPVFEPVCRLSDMLKGHTDAPIPPEAYALAEAVQAQYERLKALQ